MFDTDRDWWKQVLQMEPFEGGETLPQSMMECLVHERGFPCGHDRRVRHFEKPDGYVCWEAKKLHYRSLPNFNPPES